ncbi:unnamed protein product, partial [Caretta caretta]
EVVSCWSSGTGGAGLLGALSYLGLTQAGLSPRHTLLLMLSVPLAMLLSYYLLLVPPPTVPQWCWSDGAVLQDPLPAARQPLMGGPAAKQGGGGAELTLQAKGRIVKGLLKYLLPLALVYFAEYFINQGLVSTGGSLRPAPPCPAPPSRESIGATPAAPQPGPQHRASGSVQSLVGVLSPPTL